jgi:hypothetical protein
VYTIRHLATTGVFTIKAQQFYQKHVRELERAGWTKASFVAAATRGRRHGNPDEDFAETFAWYVYKESKNKDGFSAVDYGLSAGLKNSRNTNSDAPDKARVDAIFDLIARFR